MNWYGIEPLEESQANKFNEIYGQECNCEFDNDFKCVCGWNENITISEHKAFQDLRIVSKLGIHGLISLWPNWSLSEICICNTHWSLPKPDSDYYTFASKRT